MTPIILPVASTDVDFKNLLSAAKQALNRNISTPYDVLGKQISKATQLIPILSELESPGSTVLISTSNINNLYNHVFYSFLIGCDEDTFIELLANTKLDTTYTRQNALYFIYTSGTLKTWAEAITQKNKSIFYNHIMSEVQKYLETLQEFRIKCLTQ